MQPWASCIRALPSSKPKANPQDVVQSWEDLVEKHSWVDIPQGWDFEAPAPQDYIFDLRIGLKPTGMDDLIANLIEISDPANNTSGKLLGTSPIFRGGRRVLAPIP